MMLRSLMLGASISTAAAGKQAPGNMNGRSLAGLPRHPTRPPPGRPELDLFIINFIAFDPRTNGDSDRRNPPQNKGRAGNILAGIILRAQPTRRYK